MRRTAAGSRPRVIASIALFTSLAWAVGCQEPRDGSGPRAEPPAQGGDGGPTAGADAGPDPGCSAAAADDAACDAGAGGSAGAGGEPGGGAGGASGGGAGGASVGGAGGAVGGGGGSSGGAGAVAPLCGQLVQTLPPRLELEPGEEVVNRQDLLNNEVVAGELVAYRDAERGHTLVVRTSDLAEFLVSPEGETHRYPTLANGVLYTIAIARPYGEGQSDWISALDLATCERTVLGDPIGEHVGGLTRAGDRLLWHSADNQGRLTEIAFQDLATGERGMIPQLEPNQRNPRADGDLVVFECDDDWINRRDVCWFDFSTGEVRKIVEPGADCSRPWISGTWAVWVDERNGPWSYPFPTHADIYAKDLASTGPEIAITTADRNQLSPRIFGDVVVWDDTRNGGLPGGVYENADVYWRRLGEAGEHQLTANPANQAYAWIAGGFIYYRDDRAEAYRPRLLRRPFP